MTILNQPMIVLPSYLQSLINLIQKQLNIDIFIVGGCIRDVLLNKKPKDFDLATKALPEEIMKLDNLSVDNYLIQTLPIGIEHGTVVIIMINQQNQSKERIEITTLRQDIQCDGRHTKVSFTDQINQDLLRRDFTINAMAINIKELNKLIDPYNGKTDLQNSIIRAVGNPKERFQEDYLRMIRACRFVGLDKDFFIESKTLKAIQNNQDIFYSCLSKERIRDEILKMMQTDYPSKCIRALESAQILQYIIPSLYSCIDVDQNKHHNETVYEHCLAACDYLPKDRPILRLVGLLHDIGKPKSKKGKGLNCSFYNHELIGAKQIYNFFKHDLKLDNDACEYASLMIRHHMFHFSLNSKKSTIKRWLRKINGLEEDLFLLRIADRASNKTKINKPLITNYMQDLQNKIKDIKEHKEPMHITDLAISGKTLISMGYQPGPQFGLFLKNSLEQVLNQPSLNQIDTLKSMAIEFFKKEGIQ